MRSLQFGPIDDVDGCPVAEVPVRNTSNFSKLPTVVYAYANDPWFGSGSRSASLFPTLFGLRSRLRQHARDRKLRKVPFVLDDQVLLRGTVTWERIDPTDVDPSIGD